LVELIAYGTSSDGSDIVKPNTEGAILAMQKAIHQAKDCGDNHDCQMQNYVVSSILNKSAHVLHWRQSGVL
jgi:hypothetical protein